GERPPANQLEVAVLDRNREHRKFQRLAGPRLERLLPAAQAPAASEDEDSPPTAPAPGAGDGTE
ncbi:proteasome subunit alpha, partial [Nonomuraea dietziae]